MEFPTRMDFLTRPVLTVDIVDFSLMNNVQQINAIKKLVELIRLALPPNENHPARRLWSPGGDGGSMTFLEDSQAAIATAISLAKLIAQHNRTAAEKEQFQVRMGLHSGPVTRAEDFDGRENIWGEGINMSNRVAGEGKPGQILASREFYDDVQLHTWPVGEVTSIGRWWVKHGRSLELYNIYKEAEGVGIPPTEVDVWYGPFQDPLRKTVYMYESMLSEQSKSGPAFRVAVLAKRILDLDTKNELARRLLERISARRLQPTGAYLYDSFFSPLSTAAVRYFLRHAHFHTYPKGHTVVTEGEWADKLMMVVSGEAHIPTTDLVFGEGIIIGEMGLFSPEGRRTATLVAAKNMVTLNLDYTWLKLNPAQTAPGQTGTDAEHLRQEIRNQIWKSYCFRMIENQINSHPLFQRLSSSQRNDLADRSVFLPAEHGQLNALSLAETWQSWTIVVAGQVTLFSKNENHPITYNRGDCIGLVHLVTSECPFSEVVAASADAHLIRIPWSLIKDLYLTACEAKAPFTADWMAAAGFDRQRYFPIK